jgi:DNA-binding beta-propeller fold protein YncE
MTTRKPAKQRKHKLHRTPPAKRQTERLKIKMKVKLSIALLLCASVAALLYAADTPSPALLILAKADQVMSVVNPATLAIVGQVPSGPDPHEIVASADGKVAYISNYGGGSLHTITPVDLENKKALPVIELGALRGPHGLDFAGGKLWFTAEGAKVVGSYDPATKSIDWVLGTGQDRTHMIYVFPDLNRMLTTNVSSASMTLIEKGPARGPGGPPPPQAGQPGAPNAGPPPGARPPQINWTETVIPVGHGSEGFDVSLDRKEVWVGNAQDGTISIIDLAGKKVAQTLDANVRGANRVKFTPDGKLVFVSSLGGPDLAIFDAAARKETKRVKIGRGAAGILMQPDGSRAFVACSTDNYVAIIDLKSLEMTGKIATGKEPDGLAWAVRK